MITPITANQVIANKTTLTKPYFAGSYTTNMNNGYAKKGEKLDINVEGHRQYSLNENKIDYFA